VLRNIFGTKKDEETKDWRNVHNDKIHDLYSSPHSIQLIKSRIMRWTGYVACVGAERGANRVLVCQCKEKRPLGRPRLIWKNNIKTDPQEISREMCGLNCCGSG